MNSQAFLLLLLLLHTANQARAQPLLSAVTQHIPTNITTILEKDGHFNTLIGLLQAAGIDKQINHEVNLASSDGLTLFAPVDTAFTSLASGTLAGLTDKTRTALVKYHVLPFLVTSISVFQNMNKPLRTMGYASDGKGFPLNVITTAGHHVNLTTGLVNTRLGETVFSGGKLAVYQVDKVLFPPDMFGSKALAPSMPLAPPEKQKKLPEDEQLTDTADESAVAADGLSRMSLVVVGGAALVWLLI